MVVVDLWVVVMDGGMVVLGTKYSSLLVRSLFTPMVVVVMVEMLVVRTGGKNSFVCEECCDLSPPPPIYGIPSAISEPR